MDSTKTIKEGENYFLPAKSQNSVGKISQHNVFLPEPQKIVNS